MSVEVNTAPKGQTLWYYQVARSFDSTVIDIAWYDEVTEQLLVEFAERNHDGSARRRLYLDVPRGAWDDFLNADSAGTYYNRWIKNPPGYHYRSDDGSSLYAVRRQNEVSTNNVSVETVKVADVAPAPRTYRIEWAARGVGQIGYEVDAANDVEAEKTFAELAKPLFGDEVVIKGVHRV